jgi:hypothetical protein
LRQGLVGRVPTGYRCGLRIDRWSTSMRTSRRLATYRHPNDARNSQSQNGNLDLLHDSSISCVGCTDARGSLQRRPIFFLHWFAHGGPHECIRTRFVNETRRARPALAVMHEAAAVRLRSRESLPVTHGV